MSGHPCNLPDPFPPGARKLVFAGGAQVLVFNLDGQLIAVENSCPHAGGSLHGGQLSGAILRCPSHGMRFDLADPVSGLRHWTVITVGKSTFIAPPETSI